MRITRFAALAAVALLLAACGAEESTGPTEEPAEEETPDPPDDEADRDDDGAENDTGPDEHGTDPDDVDDGLVDEVAAAVEHAAADLDISVDEITVLRAEQVTWSDGSLGCPRAGEMYTQALVEGYRIEVEAAGERLHYHGADGDEPFRCDDPEDPTEGDVATS